MFFAAIHPLPAGKERPLTRKFMTMELALLPNFGDSDSQKAAVPVAAQAGIVETSHILDFRNPD